ncbi:MAG: hypothetical protein K5866_05160 [Treponema sp.]|nr:hypothetical protein [Treponema sp.]
MQANKRNLAEVEKEILATKAELENVHGTETEVYARIVGYYRAVKHWNAGKRDEYDQRKMFTLEDSGIDLELSEKPEMTSKIAERKITDLENQESPLEINCQDSSVSYELYTRKTCPNCPPVKDFMSHLDMEGKSIDVDTEEGLAQAAKNGVCASPTVIFYNADGMETKRCHNVEELESVFKLVAEKA